MWTRLHIHNTIGYSIQMGTSSARCAKNVKTNARRFIFIAICRQEAVKAVILAGGRGKRLRPITDHLPKPLVPIGNTPIIEWQLSYLRRNKIDDIIVCAGYKSELIEDFLMQKKIRNVCISREDKPLGTAGAIKKISPLITEDKFFIMNGDIITDIDLRKLNKLPNSIASVPLRTKFGVLKISGSKITEFREKKQIPDMWMNAGVYCLKKEILGDLPKKGDLEKMLFPDYAENGELNTVKFGDAKWYSIDSFKDIEECSEEINTF